MPLVLGPLVLLLISLKDTRERFRWFHRRTRIGRKVKKRKHEPNAKAARAGRQAHRQIAERAETAPTTETERGCCNHALGKHRLLPAMKRAANDEDA